jgi:mannan endo-1,4-beta-mannosidase
MPHSRWLRCALLCVLAGTLAACGGATALLDYMTSLSANAGAHILIGQHTNYWDSVPTDNITGLTQQTGERPAIVGVQINTASSPEGVAGSQYSGVTLANSYLSQGYIVMITEVPGSPQNGNPMWNQSNMPESPMPAANFANITISGTAEYGAFQTYLQQLASTLRQINGPVLFRPYAEQNGSWFWYGTQDPSQFAAMWQMEHDYLVAQGLTNIIWVFAANAGVGNYSTYYPGSQYVDVVGLDAYPPSAEDTSAWQQLGALGKPEIYAEAGATLVSESAQAGTDTLDNSALLSFVERNFPQVVGVVVWCQSLSLDNQNGAAAVMSDPQVITLSALPSETGEPPPTALL